MLSEAATQLSQAITFAAIGALVTIATLVIKNRADHRINAERRAEKEADRQADIEKEERDYARQDQVSQRLEEATRVNSARLEEGIALQVVTHALVNSDLTASLESELSALKEIRTLRADGPSTDDNARALKLADERIAKLQARIKDRLEQQHFAEEQLLARKALTEVPIIVDTATITVASTALPPPPPPPPTQ